MRKLETSHVVSLGILLLLTCVVSSAWGDWERQGEALCTAAGDQEYARICSDGNGGAIISWYDNRSGAANSDVYVRRVDSSGQVLWTADGVALCTVVDNQRGPTIASDGAGGAFVTWYDHRGSTNDIYAQRVDATGAVQWTADGVVLGAGSFEQRFPTIVPDGAGGAIVTWYDERAGSYDIYAQRVDASGAVQWTVDGVALCSATYDQLDPKIISDGAGGAIVTWYDPRTTGYYDIYAQRVDATGVVQWTADGVALCTAAWDQRDPRIIPDDEGGAIVTWYDYRSGTNWDIYAQRVDASGVVQWTADGVPLCTAVETQAWPEIVSDGAGGAIVTWHDYRSGSNNDIYAQRVDPSGVVQWTADGVPICTATESQLFPTIVSDSVGGAIVTWYDGRSGLGNDIYVQLVDASGAVQWTADGLALCTATGDQQEPKIASDGAGGAIVTWLDTRNGGVRDVYAQKVTRQGYWGSPGPEIISIQDVPGDQGGQLRISFAASRLDAWPDIAITHYSIWRSMSPASVLALKGHATRLTSLGAAHPDLVGRAYYSSSNGDWELIDTMEPHLLHQYGYTAATLRDSTSVDPGWESYFVSAHASGPFEFWDSAPDSGYSVDNLSPCPPAALAGQYLGGSQLWLHWNPNAEPDLSHYVVHRGTGPGFVPDEGNRIGSVMDTSFVDNDYGYGEYYYKVSAWDIHENESSFALLTPDMITGVPGTDPHYENVLFQNVPNPFGSDTQIAFSLEKAGRVSLKIFDVKGRLVRELVDEERAPSRYVEVWDGRDSRGRSVAAGTYFYRLELPGWRAVRKMTFAK